MQAASLGRAARWRSLRCPRALLDSPDAPMVSPVLVADSTVQPWPEPAYKAAGRDRQHNARLLRRGLRNRHWPIEFTRRITRQGSFMVRPKIPHTLEGRVQITGPD